MSSNIVFYVVTKFVNSCVKFVLYFYTSLLYETEDGLFLNFLVLCCIIISDQESCSLLASQATDH